MYRRSSSVCPRARLITAIGTSTHRSQIIASVSSWLSPFASDSSRGAFSFRTVEMLNRRHTTYGPTMVFFRSMDPPKDFFDAQQQFWDASFSRRPEMFGEAPSAPAVKALELFEREGRTTLLE